MRRALANSAAAVLVLGLAIVLASCGGNNDKGERKASLGGGAAGTPPTKGQEVPAQQQQSKAEGQKFWSSNKLQSSKPEQLPASGKGTEKLRRSSSAPRGKVRPLRGKSTKLKTGSKRRTKQPRRGTGRTGPRYAGVELPWNNYGYGYTGALSQVGRLWFYTGSGYSVCSGTLVYPNIVVTAAHCVRNGSTGQWYSNWLFRPAVNGTSYAGQWTGRTATVPAAWSSSPWNSVPGTGGGGYYGMDYAFVVLNRDAYGRNAGNVQGWYGMLFNAPQSAIWHLGYPAEGYFSACTANDCKPWYSYAPLQRYDQYQGGKWDVGNSQFNSGGSSGGPYFQYYNGAWYVSSVQSHMGVVHYCCGGRYGYSFFGPYFDQTTLDIFNYARTL